MSTLELPSNLERFFENCSGRIKRSFFLIFTGLLVVCALPPFYILPLGFVGFIFFFLFLMRCETWKKAFRTGWLFGIGFFGGGLFWLTNAFLVHSDQHAWLIPIAVPALAISMGLFIALTATLTFILWRRDISKNSLLARILLFAIAWCLMEWVRGVIFTGFPWNLISSVWGFSDVMMQGAAYVSVYGLSLITIIALCAPVLLLVKQGNLLKKSVVLACFYLLFIALGVVRLSQERPGVNEDIVLRLVQPNIAQADKWKRELRVENFQEHLELSVMESADGLTPTHIIWPETAATFPLNIEPYARAEIARVVPKGGLLLTGTPRTTDRGEKPYQVWNSMVAIDQFGDIVAQYDKSHLVPFGEYIPFRQYNPIPKLTDGTVDFSTGNGPTTLNLHGLDSFSPLICYEIIFPGEVVDQNTRPSWLLNLTNDGWYGNSPGPYQHLLSARFRSVEEGIALVRATNTGVSVVTDAYGQIIKALPYGVRGIIDVQLPRPIAEKTLFAKFGNTTWISLCVFLFLLAQFLILKGRKT